jgi:3-phosphoshikimate 1-carboxyvinyltransferase
MTSAHHPDFESRSPWAALSGVTEVRFDGPALAPVGGGVSVPGSKSYTNRALLVAAIARGESRVSGLLRSDDSYWCVDALRKLGVSVAVNGDTAVVGGTGGRWPAASGDLYVGSAGTVARFLPGLLAAAPEGAWRLSASASMSKRPMKTLLDALAALGADLIFEGEPGCFPFRVRGRGLNGGSIIVPANVSSQFLSGLLIAASRARGPVDIRVDGHIVQHAYVAITLDMLRVFGGDAQASPDFSSFRVEPSELRGRELALEPDISAAGYFMALAAITGGTMRIERVTRATPQPDIKLLEILERMGCRVSDGANGVVVAGPAALRGGFTVSMREMSDQALTVGVLAAFADAPVTVTEVAHIRAHESDRIKALRDNFARAGIVVEERPDGFTVHPGRPAPALFDSFDDHRVAMAFSLVGVKIPGTRISDPGCVSKTFPSYFDELRRLGAVFTLA